jgi:hypothetical protein
MLTTKEGDYTIIMGNDDWKQYLVLCNPETAKCRYHYKDEKMEYYINGNLVSKKCNSIHCPKHGGIKRYVWSQVVRKICEQYRYAWSCTLPIGAIISNEDYRMLWHSFYYRAKYAKLLNKAEYCFIKEIQHERLHLHGTIVSDEPININAIKRCWQKCLLRKLAIDKGLETIYITPMESVDGWSVYQMKGGSNTHGIQLPKQKVYSRLIQASRGFKV